MKDKYVLKGHESYSCIKELRKVSEEHGIGIYNLYTAWKADGTPASYRTGWDPKTKEILFVDPSGGPYITAGFEVEPNVRVMGFTSNDDYSNIKVIIENVIPD